MIKYKRRIKVFFDASVIFSAIYSAKGGSNKLTSKVKTGDIIGITTQTVIDEVIENIHKMRQIKADSIPQFIIKNNFFVRESITLDEIKPYAGLVDQKDAHVLAGAILTGCNYLVTHDMKHLDNKSLRSKISQTKILSPKKLIEQLKAL